MDALMGSFLRVPVTQGGIFVSTQGVPRWGGRPGDNARIDIRHLCQCQKKYCFADPRFTSKEKPSSSSLEAPNFPSPMRK